MSDDDRRDAGFADLVRAAGDAARDRRTAALRLDVDVHAVAAKEPGLLRVERRRDGVLRNARNLERRQGLRVCAAGKRERGCGGDQRETA